MANWEAQLTKRAEEVLERGVPLHQAVTVNNVTLTLVSLYSDVYNYHMVVSFEKADHTDFKEIKQLELIDMNFETKEVMTGSCSSECGICQMKDSSDKKIYFLIKGSTMQPMLEVMEFYADQLVDIKQVEYEVTPDLIDYLKAHQGEKVATQPNQQIISREQRLALQVLKDKKNIQIDSVGFIEGKLHILITNHGHQDLETYQLRMLDATGNALWPYDSSSISRTDDHGIQVVEEYSVFDIPNVEALSKYKLSIVGHEKEIIAEGPWNIGIKIQPTKEKITQPCNEMITYGSHQQAVIKELELTPLSLIIKVENENKILNEEYIGNIILNMKDSSKIILENVSAHKREGKNHLFVYTARNTFIDTKEVISITVRDKTMFL